MTIQDPNLVDIAALLNEIKETRAAIASAESGRSASIAELQSVIKKQQTAIDGLSIRLGRPIGGGNNDRDDAERGAAIDLLQLKYVQRQPKRDPGGSPFVADEASIAEAALAVRGIKHLLQTTDISSMPIDERKALTSFSVGASGFLLPLEMSTQVLSCLEDKSDVAGLMSNVSISGPGIKFLVDNAELDQAQWACQVDCWSAQHIKNLTEGLGELEIRPEVAALCALRFARHARGRQHQHRNMGDAKKFRKRCVPRSRMR